MISLSRFAAGLVALASLSSLTNEASAVTLYGVTAYGVTPNSTGTPPPSVNGTDQFKPPALISIDTGTGATKVVQPVNNGVNTSIYSPNGLGYNAQNGLFYYDSTGPSGDTLYSLDAKTGKTSQIAALNGYANATGAFFGDTYYYIPQSGTDVQRIKINADGTGTNLGGMGARFDPVTAGDLAITRDGKLYYSGGFDATGQYVLLTLDLTASNTDLLNSLQRSLNVITTDWFGQLAFVDGVLYDVSAVGGATYMVNVATGIRSYLTTAQGGFQINDISDGPQGATAAPEPMTAALLLSGLFGAIRLKRISRLSVN